MVLSAIMCIACVLPHNIEEEVWMNSALRKTVPSGDTIKGNPKKMHTNIICFVFQVETVVIDVGRYTNILITKMHSKILLEM